ncbi:MAG: S8 family serine peptidase [Bacteroidota bacterium]
MKRILLLFAIACCPFAQAQNVYPQYQDGKIWFKVKDNVKLTLSSAENPWNVDIASLPFLADIARNHQVINLSRPFFAARNSTTLQRTYQLKFADVANVDQIIAALDATGMIEYAEKVPYDEVSLTPNDYNGSTLWHLAKINATTAWNYFSTGSTIRIAIVDNAVQTTHTDLSANVWVNTGEIANNSIDDDGNGYVDDINGYDVSDNDNNPNPPNTSFDHGTHCAGAASASTNNGTGICGIGWSCKIIGVKATSNSGSPSTITDGYAGITYAVAAGARVISLSWGGTASSTTAQNIINWAYGQNAIIVAAAGNSNTNTQHYPAAYTNVIAVASTASNDVKSSFSNYGTWVDVSAPGSNIYSTVPNNAYAYMSGTSMACPIVAGLVGLMRSLNPTLPQSNVISCLTSTCDNINSINPSYSGQLGSGRINAANAMSCIAATLNQPPQAAFTANITTIPATGYVTYTDLSTFNPTTWNWSFPGGTPASFSGQTPPPIQYNTPGTYNASLTVTNGNGSSTATYTNYITVTGGTGCDTLNYPVPSNWSLVNYYVTATPPYSNGWVNGVNSSGDREKAMYFDASAYPYTTMMGCFIAFGKAWSSNPNKIVTVRVYDGTSGSPGAQLANGTATITMGQIMSDVQNFYYTRVIFANPVTLPASKRFFVSCDLTGLTWTSTPKDTLNIVSNTGGQTNPSDTWDKKSNNSWLRYTTTGTWNIAISLLIHPIITNAPPIATFTQTPTGPICAGNSYTFNATGSTYEDTLLWVFNGGSPSTSNLVNPTVIYNNPGTYTVKLYVVGGGCSMLDSMVTTVTVNANPTVTVSANPTVICPSGSSTITATGGTSYTWSPATGLSATTGATVTASPTATTTYNVVVTGSNGCSSIAPVTITVDQPPVPSVQTVPTFICVGQSINWDASASTNVNTFNWTFPGGTPGTSGNAVQSVQYNSAGTYTTTLTVSNSCGSNNSYTHTFTVGCVGIDEVNPDGNILAAYDAGTGTLIIEATDPGQLQNPKVILVNNLGQVIYRSPFTGNSGSAQMQIDMNGFASGIYYVQVLGDNLNYSGKFMK